MSEQNIRNLRRPGHAQATILVIGARGQVGFEVVRALQGLGPVVAVDRSRLDLARIDQVRLLVRETKPALIVNAAAYTAVDRAESDAEAAHVINAVAPQVLAQEASRLGSLLIHYSTDYVFDGTQTRPYLESDAPNPLNVYGRTKLAGEEAIAAVGGQHLIFRTSWVYGATGHNFMLTMLRLAREGRSELSVVDDQIGAPTWSATIASLTAHLAARYCVADHDHAWWAERSGVYHLTAAGETSWHGFAAAIFNATKCNDVVVKPVATDAYPTVARRPHNSRLSCGKLLDVFGLRAPSWEVALAQCVQEYSQRADAP